ncbi:MAG: polysaccharide deacetylase family protein [Planctomycetota bacterium]|jgi:hypothetical protein
MLRNFFLLLITAVFITSICIKAAGQEHNPEPVNRSVLALIDSSERSGRKIDKSNIHKLLEMPLNRNGFMLDYFDVEKRPLPSFKKYKAILIWFTDNKMRKPFEYYAWLQNAMKAGVKLIVINGFGADVDHKGSPVSPEFKIKTLSQFGVAAGQSVPYSDNPFIVKESFLRPDDFRFNTKTPVSGISYEYFRLDKSKLKSWKDLVRTDIDNSASSVIAAGKSGGWIYSFLHAVRYFEKPAFRINWDLNPFEFTKAALSAENFPKPDVTTFFGLRGAFSHIDGDGQCNLSLDFPGKPQKASKIVFEKVIQKYHIPVTVGLVAARVDPKALGKKEWFPLWQKIMAAENVQSGCHGYAHPMNWSMGTLAFQNIANYSYSHKRETYDAMKFLEETVFPAGQKVELMLWTGDCEPLEEAIAEVYNYGALNLNGGNARYDAVYDSVSSVCGLTRPVGRYRQVYAPAGNEYLYTNGWTENFGGFINVIDTFKMTENPKRLLPVNIYYHFYIGERQAGLASLKKIHEWAASQPLCWLHAVEYVKAVHGVFAAQIYKKSSSYLIKNYKDCLTFRFDNTSLNIDMNKSSGVLGFNHHAGDLYVSLAGGDEAEVFLSADKPDRPCLLSSTAYLRNCRSDNASWQGEARIYVKGKIVLQGLRPETEFAVMVGKDNRKVKSNKKGLLEVTLPAGNGRWLEVKVGF